MVQVLASRLINEEMAVHQMFKLRSKPSSMIFIPKKGNKGRGCNEI